MERFATRVAAVYVFIVFFPTPLDALPWVSDQSWSGTDFLYRPLVELAARALSLELPELSQTGSGDTLGDWLRTLVAGLLALALGALWTLDRRRTNDATVRAVTRDFIRLVLMTMMISYGLSKVFGRQFSPINDWTAWQTFAEFSPMGLAWRFMGYSPAYQAFAGALELTGGLLLLWRRSVTLGALLLIVVMSNVVLMNFCFDIPVKLFSTHLLAFAVVLAWPDLRRLGRVVLNLGPVQARPLDAGYLQAGWRRFLVPAVFFFYAGLFLWAGIFEPPWSPPQLDIAGYYRVERIEGARWQAVLLTPYNMRVRDFDGAWRWVRAKPEAAQHRYVAPDGTIALSWKHVGPVLEVEGTDEGTPFTARLVSLKPEDSPLATAPFHWVQEYPDNR